MSMSAGRSVVGVTGLPGAGKGAVTEWLVKQGGERVDADAIGHALLRSDSCILSPLIERFGRDILNEVGDVDRGRLGKIVFGDANALEALNGIVHPELLKRLTEEIEKYRKDESSRAEILVLDAALIPEWGLDNKLDELLVVVSPQELRAERLRVTRGWSEEDLQRREAAQWSEERKRQQATRVVPNRGSFDELERNLQALLPNLKRPRF